MTTLAIHQCLDRATALLRAKTVCFSRRLFLFFLFLLPFSFSFFCFLYTFSDSQ